MAGVAATFAAQRLNAGTLPRRDPPLPDDSLVWEDACRLVDADALAVVPGVDVDHPRGLVRQLGLHVGQHDRGSAPTAEDGQ